MTPASLIAKEERTITEFKNELGNVIRITIEGPTRKSTNDLTPLETAELNKALTKHFAPPLPDAEAVAWREQIKTILATCDYIHDSAETRLGVIKERCRDILASPPPASAGVREWRDNLYKDGKTPDRKAIDDAADEHRQDAIRSLASGEKK